MKKNKGLICMLTISILGLGAFVTPKTYFADDGGQVGHEAVIEFYRDDEKKEPPIVSSDSVEMSKGVEDPKVSKPIGRYPQTGEIVKKSLTLSGIILALAALYAYVKKQKKEHKGEKRR